MREEIEMTDKTDAEFEAWWQLQPHREQFEDVKEQMRNVWRASRAEMVIELPEDRRVRNLWAEAAGADMAYNDAVEECRNAIEAAGAKWME
jgi:hypothetical protein